MVLSVGDDYSQALPGLANDTGVWGVNVMPTLARIGALPPELQAALATRYTLAAPAPAHRVAVTTSMVGVDRATMDGMPALQLICCNGIGLDRIDLPEAARRHIAVRHTPDAVRTDTADAAVALLFATVRRVAEADRFVRDGRWGTERMSPSRRVSGMRAGIVGLGGIGTLVARRLSGLGLSVSYTGPRQKAAPWPFVPGVEALAEASDALVLCCPGGDATRGLASAAVLAALGPRGYLVNVSRGSVVDEAALLAALEAGTIAGAGLDVFADEPKLDRRFLALPNTVLQPHYAAVTQEARAEMAATLLAAVDEFFATDRTEGYAV